MKLFFSLLLPSLPPFSAFPGQGGPLSFHLFCVLLLLFCITPVFGHVQNSPLKTLFKCSSSEAPYLLLLKSLASNLFVFEQMPIPVRDSVVTSMTIFPTQLLCHFPQGRKARKGTFSYRLPVICQAPYQLSLMSTSRGRHFIPILQMRFAK